MGTVTWMLVALCLTLWHPILPERPRSDFGRRELVSAVGWSALFHGVNASANVKTAEWKFERHGEEFLIVYYTLGTNVKIFPEYKERVVFDDATFSLQLLNVRLNDSGTYKLTIDPSKDITFHLAIREPLPQPQISSSSTKFGSTIDLFCNVTTGLVRSVQWSKDWTVLSDRGSVITIQNARKSDCGNYTCRVSNEISWNESSFTLVIEGVHSSHLGALGTCVFSLFFSVVCFACFFYTCCQLAKRTHNDGALERRIDILYHVLSALSSGFLIVSFLFWELVEGPSVLIIFIVISAISLLFTLLLLAQLRRNPELLEDDNVWVRYQLRRAPMCGALTSLVCSVIFIGHIGQQFNKGCTPPMNMYMAIIPAVVLTLCIVLPALGCYAFKHEGDHARLEQPGRSPQNDAKYGGFSLKASGFLFAVYRFMRSGSELSPPDLLRSARDPGSGLSVNQNSYQQGPEEHGKLHHSHVTPRHTHYIPLGCETC